MRVNLPIIGGAYEHRSIPISAQTLKNWYVEVNPTKDQVSLQTTPGAKAWSVGSGKDRGIFPFQNQLYKVTDQTLYLIDKNGLQTAIGAIQGGARCSFVSDEFVLLIVANGRVYSYDGDDLVDATDSDQENPDFVTYLNSQAIYDGFGNRFAVSNPGELTTLDPLNYAAAESDGDDLIRPFAFNQLVYMFGTETIETWYNSGSGDPPFDRIQGGIIQIGLGAEHSVAQTDNYVYFLGDDLRVYRLFSSQADPVSTVALANEFENYHNPADAIGFSFTMQNQVFYFLTFPSDNATWLYNESSGLWQEMTTGIDEGQHLATDYATAYGKHLIADGGNVHEWDFDTLTDNGETIIRERCTGNLAAEILGPQLAGLPVTWNWLELIFSSNAPNDQDPVLMFSYSDDAGYTWSNERLLKLGKDGQYIWQVLVEQLGQSVERVYKFRLSDPISLTIQRASADIEVGLG